MLIFPAISISQFHYSFGLSVRWSGCSIMRTLCKVQLVHLQRRLLSLHPCQSRTLQSIGCNALAKFVLRKSWKTDNFLYIISRVVALNLKAMWVLNLNAIIILLGVWEKAACPSESRSYAVAFPCLREIYQNTPCAKCLHWRC